MNDVMEKKMENRRVGEHVEKVEPMYGAGGIVKWCNLCRKQVSNSSKNETQNPIGSISEAMVKYSLEDSGLPSALNGLEDEIVRKPFLSDQKALYHSLIGTDFVSV